MQELYWHWAHLCQLIFLSWPVIVLCNSFCFLQSGASMMKSENYTYLWYLLYIVWWTEIQRRRCFKFPVINQSNWGWQVREGTKFTIKNFDLHMSHSRQCMRVKFHWKSLRFSVVHAWGLFWALQLLSADDLSLCWLSTPKYLLVLKLRRF